MADEETTVLQDGADDDTLERSIDRTLPPTLPMAEVVCLPTLVPLELRDVELAEPTFIRPVSEMSRTDVRVVRNTDPPPAPLSAPAEPRCRRTLLRWLAVQMTIAGAGMASAGLLLSATTLGAVALHQTVGFEPLLAAALNGIREARPELVVPIERLEVFAQTLAYDLSLRARGAPAEPTIYALPTDRIAGPPDIPEFGPHEVPMVEFDPAILEVPLSFAPAEQGPRWMTVSRPVLNEAFPDDAALVLRFDMQQAELRWMPGKVDPWPMADRQRLADAVPAPDRSGRVPMDLRVGPFVVFGGGFQSLHFPGFGARWDGRDVIPMKRGIQTVAIYEDGQVAIGPWGELPAEGIREARQNLPPLVHQGKIPADIAYLNIGSISAKAQEEDGIRTYTNVHTWRSGLGIRQDGDLVYVLAARATPIQLAATLIRAGAVEAMQLDINASWHASPTLGIPHEGDRRPSDTGSSPLFPGIEDGGRRFLTGSDRDFLFLVERSAGGL